MKKIMMLVLLLAVCSVGYSETNDELFVKWRDQGVQNVMAGNIKNAKVCFEAALTFKSNDAEVLKALGMIEERLSVEQAPGKIEVQKQRVDIPTKKVDKNLSLRFSVGSTPGIDKTSNIDFISPFLKDGSADQDGGGLFELLVVHRFWGEEIPNLGWVLGGGILLVEHSGSASRPSVWPIMGGVQEDNYELVAGAVVFEIGGALRLGNIVVLEVEPFVGIGGGVQEITSKRNGSDIYNDSASASYLCYGVKGSAFVQLGSSVELGLEIGHHSFSSDAEIEGSSKTVTFSGGGIRAAGTISIKF